MRPTREPLLHELRAWLLIRNHKDEKIRFMARAMSRRCIRKIRSWDELAEPEE